MISSRFTSGLDGSIRSVLLRIGVGAAGLLVTVYLAHKNPGSAIVPAAVIAAVLLVAPTVPTRWRWGVLIGVLILAGINALPGPDLTTHQLTTGIPLQNGIVVLLIGVLLVDIAVHRLWRFYGTTVGRVLVLASLANIAWWTYTLLRTTTNQGIVLKHSIEVSDQLLFLSFLAPLLAASFQRRDTRFAAIVTLGLVGLIPAVFFFLASVTHSHFSVFIHATSGTTLTAGGPTRVFAPAHDLFTAAFAVSAAAALLMPAGKWRRLAVLVAVINLLAILAGQTRAQYLGTSAGFVIASLFYLRGPAGRIALRRIVVALALAGVVVLLLLGGLPHSSPSRAVRSFGTRIGSITSSFSSSDTATSTVAVRGGEETLLKQRLGSHWLLGLGFLDPRDAYDANLPFGSINNTDVGISATVMTMGVIGTVLYYLSLLAVILSLLWQSRRQVDTTTWTRYGPLAGLVGVAVSSVTLTTLFNATGVVSVATMIALGAVASLETSVSAATGGYAVSDRTPAFSAASQAPEVAALT